MVSEPPLPLLYSLLPLTRILFVLLLPSVSPLSMSHSSLPLALVRVTVGKSVLALPLLQVRNVLPLVFPPCGLAQVLALALTQACNPVTLVPVSVLPFHHSITFGRLVLPATIVHQPCCLIVTAILKG